MSHTKENYRGFRDNIFDKMRYSLTFNIAITMSLFLAILLVVFIYLDQPATIYTGIGFIACIIFVLVIYFTKEYKLAAYLFAATGALLAILTLNTVQEGFHFVDPLWMMIISLFTYFTLGKKVGNLIMITQGVGILYYIIFNLNTNLQTVKELKASESYSLAANVLICMVILIYLIQQFLKRNQIAVMEYENLMYELENKNELVEQQNQEKTAMLKEIHHRVKNNLQVITSLLRLQSREIENVTSQAHFKEAIDRVGAMALIHNQMYQSKDLDRIALEPYLKSLSKNILHSYALEIPVEINFDVQLENATSNSIVPLALIFNELMANSLKHAFNDQAKGEIHVSAFRDEKDDVEFIYEDNGNWLLPAKDDSFGLELIDALTEQLDGKVTRSTDNGTRYTFIFYAQENDH